MSNIIVDVDDTLLRWIDGFTNHLRIEHDLVLDPRNINEWELSHWTGMSQEETYNAVQDFNRTDRTFANLKPLDDSQDIINNLHLANNKLTVITCCGNSCLTRLRRHYNLNKVYGNIFNDIICIDTTQDKKEYLNKLYEPNSYIIEDNYKHAKDAIAIGYNAIVLKKTYNAAYWADSSIMWVNGWNDIGKLLF